MHTRLLAGLAVLFAVPATLLLGVQCTDSGKYTIRHSHRCIIVITPNTRCGVVVSCLAGHRGVADVLDYSCKRDNDCRDFVVPQLDVLSRCVDFQCLCTNGSSSVSQPCRPQAAATVNLVGGRCPCLVPFTVCMAGDVCRCSTNFAPTPDKRRCIPSE